MYSVHYAQWCKPVHSFKLQQIDLSLQLPLPPPFSLSLSLSLCMYICRSSVWRIIVLAGRVPLVWEQVCLDRPNSSRQQVEACLENPWEVKYMHHKYTCTKMYTYTYSKCAPMYVHTCTCVCVGRQELRFDTCTLVLCHWSFCPCVRLTYVYMHKLVDKPCTV